MITLGGMIGPMMAEAAADGRRECRIEAALAHGLDLDQAEAGGIGLRHARHRREDHAGDDIAVGEAAADVADEGVREAEDARRRCRRC